MIGLKVVSISVDDEGMIIKPEMIELNITAFEK